MRSTDYWADVDDNGGRRAHEFCEPGGLCATGTNRFEGRETIAAFYDRRRYATILTRHALSNVRVFAGDHPEARATGLMSLYRADANRRPGRARSRRSPGSG